MENYTYNSLTLQLEGLKVPEDSVLPVFLILLFSYIYIMLMNIGITVIIFVEKSLNQPMYFLFCNLPVSDIILMTNTVPHVLSDLLLPPSKRLISYSGCVVQAFITNFFSSISHTVLMIMAFDRYVAICYPLRYSSIMTNRMVIKLTVYAWGVPFVWVVVLVSLSIWLNRCRTMIMNLFCDNASLFKLSCDDVSINNIYGLTFTVILFAFSIGSMVLTYAKITVVCLTRKSKSLNSKALITCSTHLLVYLILMGSGIITIALHRFPQYSYERKISSFLYLLVPAGLNPIIYGVQTKEIRLFIQKLFCSKESF
ncbi:olfactory receptor 52N5-like [Pholidichthys leucotaenia]